MPFLQLLVAHTVPVTWRRHTPLPSQVPSRPQVEGSSGTQTLRGSDPAGTFLQVPGDPMMLQAMQFPVQSVSQHTVSTQKPDMHWPPLLHAAPLASLLLATSGA